MKKITVGEFKDICIAAGVCEFGIGCLGRFAWTWPDGMEVTEDNVVVLSQSDYYSNFSWGFILRCIVQQLAPASLAQFVSIENTERKLLERVEDRLQDAEYERARDRMQDAFHRTRARAFMAAIADVE